MATLILIAVLLLVLGIVVVGLYIRLSKRLPPDDPEHDFYDEDGNHLYYDRKLIAQLQKEREQNATGSQTHH